MKKPLNTTESATSQATSLRQRAEKELQKQHVDGRCVSPEETQLLHHELEVHQIELELQNDELRRVQAVLDASRTRYFDLYDLAPVGYCTLDAKGLILEANLTAATLLGVARGALVQQPLSRYIPGEDANIYYLHRKKLVETGGKQVCEVRMSSKNSAVFWGRLEMTATQDDKSGSPVYRAVISDITEQKQLENAQLFLLQCACTEPCEDFFASLARYLAESLHMDYVCIDQLLGEGHAARTVAVYFDGKFEDNVEYTLKDTPCGDVVGKTICCFQKDVRTLFPRDAFLQVMGAESYVGASLWSARGKAIGLIAVIGRIPLVNPGLAESILKLAAVRAACELERRQSEESLQLTQFSIDTAGYPIVWVDSNARLLFVNDAACLHLGYTRKELLRMTVHNINPDYQRAEWLDYWRDIKQQGILTFETRHTTKDGRCIPVEVTTNYLEFKGTEYNCVLIRDITRQKYAEEENRRLNEELEQKVVERTAQLQQTLDTLRESEERYRTVADFTFAWEFWVSPDNKYLYVSPSFERITGYPAQTLLDDFCFLEKIIHPDDAALIIPHMGSSLQTDSVPIDFRIITRSGEERWISHECQQVYAPDGRHLGNRGSNRDITEMKRLRDEAVRDAHLASIGRLAASVAHEINNPISGVINYAQIIRKKCFLEDKYKEFLDEIVVESERIATIVKDLLMFARPDSGEQVPTDLHDIYVQTFSLISKQLDKNFITVKANFPDDLPPVLVRPQQIKQVVLNLFTNALYALNKKFPDDNPKKILQVDAQSASGRKGPRVSLTFYDHGIGIPADMTSRVCDPFFSTKPPGEGTGLGLSISYTIIKDHGGSLLIDSREGDYTKVIVELPAMEGGQ